MSFRRWRRDGGPARVRGQHAVTRQIMPEPLEGRRLMCAQHLVDGLGMSVWGNGEFYLPDGPQPVTQSAAGSAQEALLEEITTPAGLPILNSVPGAPTAVYLDFDGFVSATENTAPYDTDGNPATFNTTEQADITEAWRHVASYFAMFNTNVTTVRPTVPFSYSMITNSNTGVGYSYGGFPTTTPRSYNPSGDARTRQSGIAHEIGHNFGLAHQSDYDLLGDKIREYSNGYDNLHGPIMGVDYAQSVHKWFIGHPSDSASRVQDDVQVIADKIRPYSGGDGMRPDDVPNVIASARAMTNAGGVFSASGIIERLSDADAYSFVSPGAQMRFDLVPPNPSMLDAKLEVYSTDGTLIATADGSTNDQHLTVPLPAGTFYAFVRSHGDYGDLGTYDLTVRSAGALPAPPTYNSLPAPAGLTLSRGAGTTVSATWGAVTGATGYVVERSSDGVSWSAAGSTAGEGATGFADSATLNGGRRYFYRVSALDGAGRSAPAISSLVTRPNSVSSLTLTSYRPDQVILNWRDVSGDSGYRVERQTDATANTWTTVATVGTNVPAYTVGGLALGTSYRFRVTALGGGAGDSVSSEVTGSTRLPAITGLAFTNKQSNRMGIRWNTQSTAATYRVQRSTNGIDWDTMATVPATQTAYEDSNNVRPMLEYYYRVVPLNGPSTGMFGTPIFAATPAATPLPAPWVDRDIGSVGGTGAAGLISGTYTVIASGADIWDPADSFHFTYQPLVGDGEITARVFSQEPTAGWAKAGVMIRESLTNTSRHAMMVVTPDNGTAFQYRTTTGGTSGNNNTGGPFAPYWVRLVRQGSTLIGYRSNNGTTWTEQARTTISMGANTFIGLAVVSSDNSELATVTFTNVTVSNRAPTVATAAAATPSPVTGTTATLTALGADDHGESNLRYTWSAQQSPDGAAAPLFSDGNTNAAKSVTATFSMAGTYVLRVTVTDSSGLTTSSSVSVQVVPTATALRVSPAGPMVAAGQTLQMSAALVDQFGQPVIPAPVVNWYAESGTIDGNGLFTAPSTPGRYRVAADGGGFMEIVEVDVVEVDLTAPTLVSAASSKTHGRRGTFDLPLALDGATVTVEPRQGGATRLRLAFSEPIGALDGSLDASEFVLTNATFASVSVDNSPGVFVITLNVAGIIDASMLTVGLNGLSDLAGNGLAGDRDVSVRSLFGDVNGSGGVNNADVLAVRAGLDPSATSAWNYLLDLDLGGSVNSRDVLLARAAAARTLALRR